jgi:4-amino-4-deoxy-L-arabinose transferase-like glycosyltransferase
MIPFRQSVWLLAAIVVVYLILGVLYASYTPPWQVPDEPAHYNYIRYLAENGNLPILQMGDYPHDYLEHLKAERFPPGASIEPIRYEYYQPPLYYILATPLYLIFGGQLLPLRLFSLIFGSALLVVAYRLTREVFGDDALMALGTAATVAFVPMHIAITAGVNNDTLGELLLSMLLLLMLRRLKNEIRAEHYARYSGLLLGLALLTKPTTYVIVPMLILAEFVRWALRRAETKRAGEVARTLAWLLGIGLILSGPWFVRNLLTYGDFDLIGKVRHDAIVVGQLQTGIFDLAAARHFVTGSFKSFWAQFGWMGVLVDKRIYLALALLCGVAALGLLLFIWRSWRGGLDPYRCWALFLLAAMVALVLGADLWYNLKFVQTQGRYLFPAIVPIGLFFVLGLREVLSREHENFLFALVFLGLAVLDVICLFGFVVPALA